MLGKIYLFYLLHLSVCLHASRYAFVYYTLPVGLRLDIKIGIYSAVSCSLGTHSVLDLAQK